MIFRKVLILIKFRNKSFDAGEQWCLVGEVGDAVLEGVAMTTVCNMYLNIRSCTTLNRVNFNADYIL